jgi:hypothetical protein
MVCIEHQLLISASQAAFPTSTRRTEVIGFIEEQQEEDRSHCKGSMERIVEYNGVTVSALW